MTGQRALLLGVTAEQECLELLGVTNGSLVANRQFVATLCTAASKHGTSVSRFHAHTKPVSLGTLSIVRLKCTFWH
jgi:hypothetical protein